MIQTLLDSLLDHLSNTDFVSSCIYTEELLLVISNKLGVKLLGN